MQASGLGPRAFRSAIFALDVGLRRASHAFEYDFSSECIFRISLGEAGRTCILDQGERLEPSDPVVDLHFWNEHMPAMSSSGPDVAWGRRMHRALCFSFSALALRLETDSGLKSAKAVRITTLIGQDGAQNQFQRVMRRYGFVRDRTGQDARRLGQNALTLLFTLACNPVAAKLNLLWRRETVYLASRRQFRAQFATAGQAS